MANILVMYLKGIGTRIYWLLPSFLSDPFDIAERWFGVSYTAPPYMFWVLLFLGFCVASFLTYYHDVKGIQDKKQRQQIREILSGFLVEGENIRDSCYNQNVAAPKKEAHLWVARVKGYIAQSLGNDYANSFMNSDGLGTAKIQRMGSLEHTDIALHISYRLMRIQEILAELRQK